MGYKYLKQLMHSGSMTSQTDNQFGKLCSDFHCSTVFHNLNPKIIFSLFNSDLIFLKFVCFVSPVFLHLLKQVIFWSGHMCGYFPQNPYKYSIAHNPNICRNDKHFVSTHYRILPSLNTYVATSKQRSIATSAAEHMIWCAHKTSPT